MEDQKDNNELVENSKVLRTKTINYKNVMKLYESDLKEKKKDFKKFEGGPDDFNTKLQNKRLAAGAWLSIFRIPS